MVADGGRYIVVLTFAVIRMSTGPTGSTSSVPKSVPKADKNGKKGDDNIVIKVAGVVVATGIAYSLYRTFARRDHPLVNTEKGIKKDASNAYDNAKVRLV